jgi:hypothetical protein
MHRLFQTVSIVASVRKCSNVEFIVDIPDFFLCVGPPRFSTPRGNDCNVVPCPNHNYVLAEQDHEPAARSLQTQGIGCPLNAARGYGRRQMPHGCGLLHRDTQGDLPTD